MGNKKSKTTVYLYIFLAIAGITLACSSIISNDYVKLLVVMVTLCIGLYGIMKSLSNPEATKEEKIEE